MPSLRSRTVTHGRNMAGARALLRAAGVDGADFGKPIIAVANSFTEFVPGHTHLQPVGRIVSRCDQGRGRHPPRVQHHRRGRRHRDGPQRDALLAALARPHRRLRRVHGQRAPGGRPRVHLELRQDHARDAHGRPPPEHPDGVRVGRPHGVRPGDPRRRHGAHARPRGRDLGRRQRERSPMPTCSASRRPRAPRADRARGCSRPTR